MSFWRGAKGIPGSGTGDREKLTESQAKGSSQVICFQGVFKRCQGRKAERKFFEFPNKVSTLFRTRPLG